MANWTSTSVVAQHPPDIHSKLLAQAGTVEMVTFGKVFGDTNFTFVLLHLSIFISYLFIYLLLITSSPYIGANLHHLAVRAPCDTARFLLASSSSSSSCGCLSIYN
jgi:hypothetical protein